MNFLGRLCITKRLYCGFFLLVGGTCIALYFAVSFKQKENHVLQVVSITRTQTKDKIDQVERLHGQDLSVATADAKKSEFFLPKIIVNGIVIDGDNKFAYISIAGKSSNIFEEGAEIHLDIYLNRITQTSVVLNINGVDRVYRLSASSVDQNATDPTEEFLTSRLLMYPDRQSAEFYSKLLDYINGRQLAAVEFPLGVSSYGVEKISEYEYLIDLLSVEEQMLTTKPFRHAKLHFEKEGVAFEEIVPGSLYDKSGFSMGDRIVTIDGTNPENVMDIYNVYQKMEEENSITVLIERDGALQELKYSVY